MKNTAVNPNPPAEQPRLVDPCTCGHEKCDHDEGDYCLECDCQGFTLAPAADSAALPEEDEVRAKFYATLIRKCLKIDIKIVMDEQHVDRDRAGRIFDRAVDIANPVTAKEA